MAGFYLGVYHFVPEFLKRRINPLEYAIQDFVRSACSVGREVVLDAGAGEGRFAPYFATDLYVALDSAVGAGNWDYSRLDIQADLVSIPLVSASVNTAMNIQVLEHVTHPELVLKEIYRVLKPGGRLYLTAPQGWHEHQIPHDYFRFTQFSLQLLLRSAGFRKVRVEPMGGYFHYLGHRLTYVPKILFFERGWALRALFLPLEWLILLLCCFLGPIACYYLDELDRERYFTLCYRCLAIK